MKRDREVQKHDLPPETLDAVGLVLAQLARTEPELSQTLRAAVATGSDVPDPEIAKRLFSLLVGRLDPLRTAAEVANTAQGDVSRARSVLTGLVAGDDGRVPPELHRLLAEVATQIEPIDAAGLLDATRALAEDLARGTTPPEHVARRVEGLAQRAAELGAALRTVDAAAIERQFQQRSGAVGVVAAAQAHELTALAELRAIDAAAAAGGGAAARSAAAPRIDAAIEREDFTAAARLLEHVAIHEARAGETVERLQSLQQAATAWARAGEAARGRETMDAVLEAARTSGVLILARSLLSSGQIAEMASDAGRARADYEALLALAPAHPEVARWAARASFNLGRVLRFSDPKRAAIALDGARTLSARVGDAYVHARAAMLRAEDLASTDRAAALMIMLDARTALATHAPDEAAAVDAAAAALGERWGQHAFECALHEARARRRPAQSE